LFSAVYLLFASYANNQTALFCVSVCLSVDRLLLIFSFYRIFHFVAMKS